MAFEGLLRCCIERLVSDTLTSSPHRPTALLQLFCAHATAQDEWEAELLEDVGVCGEAAAQLFVRQIKRCAC